MARIVVIGSVAQDEVLSLAQPLDEGRHLDARERTLRLGGGGANTAIPLRHSGHEVVLLAPVGSDPLGDWLLEAVQAAGLEVSGICRVPGDSTRSLVLVDPSGERTIVNLHRCRESGLQLRLRSFPAEALYVRSRELDVADLLAERANDSLVVAHVPPLAADSRPATVLVGSASDLPEPFLANPWAYGREIAGEALRWVVITRGATGAEAHGPGSSLRVPAPAVEVVDTTAAGDAFAAGLVHALVQRRPMEEALRVAISWGSATVACAGLPDAEVIRRLA